MSKQYLVLGITACMLLASPLYAQEQDGVQSGPDFSNVSVDDYFDAEMLEPPLAGQENPDYEFRALDPEKDKASRFVVVDKEYHQDSLEARLASAKRAIDLGRFDAGLRLYKALYEEYPKDHFVLLGYASALQHKGNTERAIKIYEALLEIDEDNLDAHINMLGLVAQRYPAVALQRLKILEAKADGFQPALIGQIAFVQARLGRFKEALDSYATIASREPNNALHVLNMGIVADKAGMKSEAIRYYEEALQIDTVYSSAVFDRGQIFDRLAQLR